MRSVPADGALLSVERASVGWGRRVVLRDVSFTLARHDYLGIVGPNGSGKSTLLRALLGLAAPRDGRIVRSPEWRAGYVPQRDALEPLFRLCAFHVVEMFARVGAASAAAAADATHDALRAVGMEAAEGRVYRDLSGGERQRILIARALAVRPSVLVLDEPTTGMDVRAEAELLALVRRVREGRGLAVVLVTHSLHVVADEAETVGILHGDGAEFGRPETVLSPENLSRIYGCDVTSEVVRGRRLIRASAGGEVRP